MFNNGHIDFSDKNIKSNYSANMLNLTGSVTGLSSKEFSRADVALKGNRGMALRSISEARSTRLAKIYMPILK